MKEVICKSKVDLVLLQETKLHSMIDSIVNDLWENTRCKWVCLDAIGSSRGILVCWNSRTFVFKDHWCGIFSVFVVLEDKANNSSWIVSSVYGPLDHRLCDRFWSELDSIRNKCSVPWCLEGDWNITRFPKEKSGGGHISVDMEAFLDWINSQCLVNLHLGGAKFVWSNSNHQNPPHLGLIDFWSPEIG